MMCSWSSHPSPLFISNSISVLQPFRVQVACRNLLKHTASLHKTKRNPVRRGVLTCTAQQLLPIHLLQQLFFFPSVLKEFLLLYELLWTLMYDFKTLHWTFPSCSQEKGNSCLPWYFSTAYLYYYIKNRNIIRFLVSYFSFLLCSTIIYYHTNKTSNTNLLEVCSGNCSLFCQGKTPNKTAKLNFRTPCSLVDMAADVTMIVYLSIYSSKHWQMSCFTRMELCLSRYWPSWSIVFLNCMQ